MMPQDCKDPSAEICSWRKMFLGCQGLNDDLVSEIIGQVGFMGEHARERPKMWQ